MQDSSKSLLNIVLPKKKQKTGGTSVTNTFNPSASGGVISAPDYRDHLTDIFTTRQSSDSRVLLKGLFKQDPDVSAAVHAFLTVSDTEPRFVVRNQEGEVDPDGMALLRDSITRLTKRVDYTQDNFKLIKSLKQIAEDCRYMILLTGGLGAELVFDKLLLPTEIRQVNLNNVEWVEAKAGKYLPVQKPESSSEEISLDIPTFFVKFYRQSPTEIYGYSLFVSAINTVAARQQVINDLYRIMQKTGYPRIEITVLEEIILKNAPAEIRADEAKRGEWVAGQLNSLAAQIEGMRPDSTFIHSDAYESKILNDRGAGAAMDVSSIIDTLNAQNQAALKTLPTFLGRGESGMNTASVEARVFSMTSDSLNRPIADFLSDMFSLILQLQGFLGFVECKFDEVEMRPALELEPQLTMKQSRLQSDLSLGIITDMEYHLAMYNRPPPDGAEELQGTNFLVESVVDVNDVSPNDDPLGRSLTSPDADSAKSNKTKKGGKK